MNRMCFILFAVLILCTTNILADQDSPAQWDARIYLRMILEKNHSVFNDTTNINTSMLVLKNEMRTVGPYPKYALVLGAFYLRKQQYDSMNVYFDSTLIGCVDTTLNDSLRNPYPISYYENTIDSIRTVLWKKMLGRRIRASVSDYLTLAIKHVSHEPHAVRLRNNLSRIQIVYDSLGSLPDVFLEIGKTYRELGVIDSMHIFFDSTLLYCADEALLYNDRANCEKYDYPSRIARLRKNIIGAAGGGKQHIGRVLFYDNFAFNVYGWPEGRFGGAGVGLGGGKYAISLFSKENLVVPKIEVRLPGSYILKTPIRKSDGSDTDAYGMVWRGSAKNDFLTVLITGEGLFSVKSLEQNVWTDIIPWKRSTAIRTGNAVNDFRIEQNGPDCFFYINDELAGKARILNDFGDFVGYLSTGAVTLSSEYMLIYQPVNNDS